MHQENQAPTEQQYRVYYIVQKEPPMAHDFSIITVNPVDEANFLEDYGQYVLAKGNSMMEALLDFEQKKK